MSALRRVLERPAALLTAVYVGLATLAVTTSAPGRYVGENRVDQYFAPGRRLVRTLWLWDPTRGMGRTREDLWPVELGPLALLRSVGLGPVAAQRAWHGILLVVAAAGATVVLLHLRAAVRDEEEEGTTGGLVAPLIAGLVYGFGPYAITFLTPANLFVAYAFAPWVVLCALRGGASTRPWRSAAAAALLVGALGNADYPGVVMAMVTVPLAVTWAAVTAGAGWRRAVAWLVRWGALTVAVSAAALWKTLAAAAVFRQRVSTTETPEIVGVASSWSETWRGLGFWLSYFRSDVLARPQTSGYFTDPGLVLVTFVPAFLALLALALPEVKVRALLGLNVVVAGIVMVGVHPVRDAVPLGRIVLEVLEASSATAGFRTTYKAGAGLLLGVAVLAGLATEAVAERARRRGQGRILVAVGAVGAVAMTGLPAWTGDLYDATRTSGEVPQYWYDAASAIDAQPGTGRLLVLPASTRTVYDWGWVGDDILDSLISRPHAVDTAVPLSGPEAADVLAAVSQATVDARHRPGAVAAVLRRLGIDQVLIRNDVDAEATRTVDPAAMERLRRDPGLVRLATFGGDVAGEGTASSGDSALAEGRLELYRVVDPGATGPRLAVSDDQLVVSGSGDALLGLGADGDLGTAGPVRFSGAMTTADAAAALADGRLVLSDTNRRRVTVVSALVRNESWTLAEDQDLDRPAGAIFDTPGSQSVAWFRDATAITSDGAARGGRGAQPWTRPAAAFDANPATWWQTIETSDQEGITLRVDLREATTIGRVRVDPLDAPRSARRLTAVDVRFSDGTRQRLDLTDGATEVDVDAGSSTWVEITIAGVSDGADRPVGIREVELEGLDLREWIALPDDLARAAERDDTLADALGEVPFSALMTRDQPEAPFPVEPILRRRVRLPHDADVTVTAVARPLDAETVDLLTGLRDECGSDEALTIDGEAVPLTLADPEAPLDVGRTVALRSCDPVAMDAGWGEVETRAGGVIESVRLDSGDPPVAVAGDEPVGAGAPVAGEVQVDERSPDRMELTVDAPDGAVLVTGESYDERWFATVDGRDLGAADLYDGQSGWVLPAGTDLQVELRFRPGNRFRIASWVTLAAVAACLALVATGRGRRGPRTPRSPEPADRRAAEPSAHP